MTARYLVDTDWAINYLNGHQPTVSRLHALQPDGLAISVISVAELYEGVLYSTTPLDNERALDALLSVAMPLGINQPITRRFGQERGRLRSTGQIIGDMDILIGATALVHKLTLLTNNLKHFSRFVDLQCEAIAIG
mgnify:CR=1 FL=1